MKKIPEKKNREELRKYVISVLFFGAIFAVGLGSYYFGKSTQSHSSDQSQFSFLNPVRKFLEPKDLIVNVQSLRDELNSVYEGDPDVSLYFEYLATGASISINKDAQFYPASLLKIPVAIAVAKKIDKREWEWGNKLVLMATDKDDKFGTLYKEPTGSIYTIEELVRRSLVDSDNTAHFILIRNLETSEIENVYTHMGLDGFLETDGGMSAKRYSVILRTLYNASFLSEENSEKLISFLAQEPFREYLGSGLPETVTFAHKIGIDTSRKVYLDSGILYLERRPYILIVMTKEKTQEQAQEIMKNISEKVYTYVKDYQE